MSEVMHLHYEANGPSIRVTVDAIKMVVGTDGVERPIVQPHMELPRKHLMLTELAALDANLAKDLRSVIARLEPIIRKAVTDDLDHPDAIRQEANRLADERHQMQLERAEHERAKVEHERMKGASANLRVPTPSKIK